jgi:CcmD family protein
MTSRMRACLHASVLVVMVSLLAGKAVPAQPTAAPPAGAAAQTTGQSAGQPAGQTAAQDEFVPIDELPPEDRLPAAPFLVAAYTITLVLLAGYVWLLWRRLGVVQHELNEVRRATRSGGAPM